MYITNVFGSPASARSSEMNQCKLQNAYRNDSPNNSKDTDNAVDKRCPRATVVYGQYYFGCTLDEVNYSKDGLVSRGVCD